mmetsp:Transcript_19559/g.49025  ORF Transcript_19559/g.49025 Transcript_19559/m.49025 type:complete len:222 (+) Transcript_19559:451-1116(+)
MTGPPRGQTSLSTRGSGLRLSCSMRRRSRQTMCMSMPRRCVRGRGRYSSLSAVTCDLRYSTEIYGLEMPESPRMGVCQSTTPHPSTGILSLTWPSGGGLLIMAFLVSLIPSTPLTTSTFLGPMAMRRGETSTASSTCSTTRACMVKSTSSLPRTCAERSYRTAWPRRRTLLPLPYSSPLLTESSASVSYSPQCRTVCRVSPRSLPTHGVFHSFKCPSGTCV